MNSIPLSLYIHMPWCIRKCPYCDFNSHAIKNELPETSYIEALLTDLKSQNDFLLNRKISSIFIGGGTPSLFSAESIKNLMYNIANIVDLEDLAEITMEANPGTFEQEKFSGFLEAGINRLSIGCQSFNSEKLKALGRIHSEEEAIRAIKTARKIGFKNINLDLMYGLPEQSLDEALDDLKIALELNPEHLSWYHLTLEPNTYFHRFPPSLPNEDLCFEIQEQGQALLKQAGYQHYEISAYTKPEKQSHHNLNYWQFGDYLGIGAGSHGKITLADHRIIRTVRSKNPKDYLLKPTEFMEYKQIPKNELPFEFMLNNLRLNNKIDLDLFESRTGLSLNIIKDILDQAKQKGFLTARDHQLWKTAKGSLFLNNLMEMFLTT